MSDLLLFLGKSIIAGALFFGFYQLFMRRESYFTLNRFYLLVTAALIFILPFSGSFLLPGILIPAHETRLPVITLPEVVIRSSALLSPEQETALINWATVVYSLISAAMLAGLVLSLARIYRFIRSSQHSQRLKDNIYILPEGTNPFSFNGRIFVPEDYIGHPALSSIITHENAHLRQKHVLDLVFIELLSGIFWFNPFLFLIKRALRETHEYLADREVVKQGMEPVEYQQLLYSVISGNPQYIIANNFNLLTKKRIVMLQQKSKKSAALRIGLLLPVILSAAIMVALLQSGRLAAQKPDTPAQPLKVKNEVPKTTPAVREQQKPATKPSRDQKSGKSQVVAKEKQVVTDEDVFTVVEEPPQFPGGDEARIQYMISSIKYPDEARKKGVQGTVFISFIVEPDGSISHTKVLRGVGGGCDEEALRVINGMPNWIPGKQKGKPVRVQFNMPIKFTLDNSPKTETK